MLRVTQFEMIYDVAVVGAGVVGSSTAYHLVQKGGKRVILLEQVTTQNTCADSTQK